MKYKVGNKVRIKSLDWYNQNKTSDHGYIDCGAMPFVNYMAEFCGKIVTISYINSRDKCYEIEEDDGENGWTDEMIEGIVKETLIERVDDKGLPFNEWLSHKGAFHVPDGYELRDENGNIINTKKIVLEKKERYPKTYEECSLINDCEDRIPLRIIGEFTRLINARNAYWKIAGDEMGLGKSWEPDYKNPDIDLYVIINIYNQVEKAKYGYGFQQCVFTFPTAEMRDAFYENFKDLIEQCKELL